MGPPQRKMFATWKPSGTHAVLFYTFLLIMRFLHAIPLFLVSAGAMAAPIPDAAPDWLIDPAPYKSAVTEDRSRGELVMDNGLARRVFRLGANAVTAELKSPVTGENLLRTVSPEARVTIDGVEYPVGGLAAPKIQNFLRPEWVASLRALPGAYRFTGWSELPVSERLKWKKRPEWLARDVAWPPPGKHIVMRYAPPEAPPASLAGPVVYEERFGAFRAPEAGWKLRDNGAHPRASFMNEGKAGEILAPADSAVYAERPWSDAARSVEVALDAGDDTLSNACGPGLAFVAADGSTAHFVIRPNQRVFETPAGLAGKFDRDKPVRLRVRLEPGRLVCEAAQADAPFRQVATLPWEKKISALRVGKVGRSGKGRDEPGAAKGALVRCHILSVALRGAEPVGAPAPRRDLPDVEVHYELYDGLPVFAKWLVVNNARGAVPVRLNRFVAEELRFSENVLDPDGGPNPGYYNGASVPGLWVETDYAFGGSMAPADSNRAVAISTDPGYATQVNYDLKTPALLRCLPPEMGPDVEIRPGDSFRTFHTFELLPDSTDTERRTLARRRMYRAIAPWTNENPLMFHKVESSPAKVREAIDQAAEAGFEMVILSFGSGFNFESRDGKYWDSIKELADYGRSKGVALGGYSLLASRHAGVASDDTQGQKTTFGAMPCLGSRWGREYLDNIAAFARHAGIACFENDGSYPGDRCAATNHPHHRGLADSQWVMWKAITDQYKALRAEGVFLNIPDWYYLSGANKCGMGYRETNWSLPRAEQEIIERQNMYDGTWFKTQTMGWMFVPLSQYHGGGAAATIEPLREHLPHYEARFANLLGYGVQACFRGPRLFDSPETKALVVKWTGFYKRHREVLDFGDILHLRRPDGRDWDGIVHVNPSGKEKALAFLYNPLPVEIERRITIPLRYAGLAGSAKVRFAENEAPQTIRLDAEHRAVLTVKIPAGGHRWALFE